MNERKTSDSVEQRDENRDPLSGAPGAHPVGTGVGAAGGGAAGAAIGTALGGPIGAGIGIVAGAVIGGLAGKGAAEAVDPTAEDAYWRENYRNRDYVDRDASYQTYQPAYRTGYEGFARYPGRRYEDVEEELRRNYEQSAGRTGLGWEKARYASRDAWSRLESNRNQGSTATPTGTAPASAGASSDALGSSATAATSNRPSKSGETDCGCSCG
jgi:hypothetical protein